MEREQETMSRAIAEWPVGTWVQFRSGGQTAWGVVKAHTFELPYAAGAARRVMLVVESFRVRKDIALDAVVS